ncbi:hypothetical protein KC315_g11156 [Hortaea werneckii]|nr:hypothetical protein KC315_g11156 [Hortaea werneckii]
MPHDISVKTLRKFLEKVNWEKVQQKAKNASKGDRIFPSWNSKDDAKNNFRLDRGSEVDGKPEVVLQANKNADGKKVKQAARKDSHDILAKGIADPSEPDLIDQIMADFKNRKSS